MGHICPPEGVAELEELVDLQIHVGEGLQLFPVVDLASGVYNAQFDNVFFSSTPPPL